MLSNYLLHFFLESFDEQECSGLGKAADCLRRISKTSELRTKKKNPRTSTLNHKLSHQPTTHPNTITRPHRPLTMPKALSTSKVTKAIARKTGKHGPKRTAPLHGSSRDAARLSRAAARDARVATTQAAAQKGREALLARVAHFHAVAVAALAAGDDGAWSGERLAGLVDAFVGRAGHALEVMAKTRRAGRAPAAEELRIRGVAEREGREFDAGFWCPDVRDPEVRSVLREWKGEWGGLGTVAFVRVRRDGAVKEDRWPLR